MSRLIFFLLLIAAIAFGFHVWLTAKTETSDYSTREKNRDEVRLVAVTSSATAARNAEDARRTMQSLAGSACVEFSGIAAADAQRARDAFNTLQLGTRLAERRVGRSRYWVFVAPRVTENGRGQHGQPAQAGRDRHVDPPRQRDLARRLLHQEAARAS